MADFADRAQAIVKALAAISRHQGAELDYRVLSRASASLVKTGYDNWDGGTDLHTLILKVPLALYADIEAHQEALERSILDRIKPLIRTEYGNWVSEVVIAPPLDDSASGSGMSVEDSSEVPPSFWQPGYFRVFITHLSDIKHKAHALKKALWPYQIAAFVAHDDIEPTKEWQAEIETALRTLDALVAVITPGLLSKSLVRPRNRICHGA